MPQVAKAMFALRRASAPAATSCRISSSAWSRSPACCAPASGSRSGASATCDSREAELVQRFFDGIEKYSPDLVSWNGGGFDLPVLHYRALLKAACRRRATGRPGEEDTGFRYNNYLSRYHWRHTGSHGRAVGLSGPRRAPRSPTWRCCSGFPGKLGFAGSQVWEACLAGELAGRPPLLRDRCAQHLARSSCASRSCAARSRASSMHAELERVKRAAARFRRAALRRSSCGPGRRCA